MEHKYINIERLRPRHSSGFQPGDHIVVQEKIDGSNFSICYDREQDRIRAFGRKSELDEKNHLRGAWSWTQKQDKEKIKAVLGDRYILFAEWLVHHAVPYPEERYEKVYCFDVMEKETGKYLPQDQVKEMVTELGLTYVPVFYDGPFVSWEAIEAMVGRTELGGAYGEGVVVKNMTRLNDPNEKLPFYTKIVGADFAEKKSISRTHMEQMSADAKRQALADSVVTEARVRKMILKLVDENLLSENWREEKQETISRQLTRQISYDCVKEEPETVEQIGKQFGKYAAISTTNRVREMMKNQK